MSRAAFSFYGWCLIMGIVLAPCTLRAVTTDNYGGTYASWPADGAWTAIPSLNDPRDTGIDLIVDFVGDSTDPCAYFAKNDAYLFFRIRMAANINTFQDSIWIYVDAVGNRHEGVPEYAFAWDTLLAAANHGLELQKSNTFGNTWGATDMADMDNDPAKKTSPPDFALTGGEGYIRVSSGHTTTNLGTTTFIDWAISKSVITGRTTLGLNNWKIQLGSRKSGTDHNTPQQDVAANSTPTTAGLAWSDSIPVPEATMMAVLPALLLVWRRGRRRQITS